MEENILPNTLSLDDARKVITWHSVAPGRLLLCRLESEFPSIVMRCDLMIPPPTKALVVITGSRAGQIIQKDEAADLLAIDVSETVELYVTEPKLVICSPEKAQPGDVISEIKSSGQPSLYLVLSTTNEIRFYMQLDGKNVGDAKNDTPRGAYPIVIGRIAARAIPT